MQKLSSYFYNNNSYFVLSYQLFKQFYTAFILRLFVLSQEIFIYKVISDGIMNFYSLNGVQKANQSDNLLRDEGIR
jgi:hypothetical protein